MEARGEAIEVAAKPMETLGERLEQEITAMDSEVRREIERAVREGRAEPAPTRQ
jgi:hypothetical protein